MKQMPEEMAVEGRKALLNAITYAESEGMDGMGMKPEVTSYLREIAENATLEEVEVIMGWMFIGAIADRLMHRMQAQEMLERVLGSMGIQFEPDDSGLEA